MEAVRKTLFHIGIAGAALALAGAASGSAAKPILTISISGPGSVTSHPAGISCRPHCTLHGRVGEKVTLVAAASANAEFSHWSAPCGTSDPCTIKLTGSRVIHAFFKATPTPPPAPSPPPPPAPPPPQAKSGHYPGTYSDGSTFTFDVQGSVLTNLAFDFNGHCSDGGNLAGPVTQITGSFPIASDGSVSGHITLDYSNASGAADFAGRLTSAGSGSGTMTISVSFNDGSATCTSSGTWTAQAP